MNKKYKILLLFAVWFPIGAELLVLAVLPIALDHTRLVMWTDVFATHHAVTTAATDQVALGVKNLREIQ